MGNCWAFLNRGFRKWDPARTFRQAPHRLCWIHFDRLLSAHIGNRNGGLAKFTTCSPKRLCLPNQLQTCTLNSLKSPNHVTMFLRFFSLVYQNGELGYWLSYILILVSEPEKNLIIRFGCGSHLRPTQRLPPPSLCSAKQLDDWSRSAAWRAAKKVSWAPPIF